MPERTDDELRLKKQMEQMREIAVHEIMNNPHMPDEQKIVHLMAFEVSEDFITEHFRPYDIQKALFTIEAIDVLSASIFRQLPTLIQQLLQENDEQLAESGIELDPDFILQQVATSGLQDAYLSALSEQASTDNE